MSYFWSGLIELYTTSNQKVGAQNHVSGATSASANPKIFVYLHPKPLNLLKIRAARSRHPCCSNIPDPQKWAVCLWCSQKQNERQGSHRRNPIAKLLLYPLRQIEFAFTICLNGLVGWQGLVLGGRLNIIIIYVWKQKKRHTEGGGIEFVVV